MPTGIFTLSEYFKSQTCIKCSTCLHRFAMIRNPTFLQRILWTYRRMLKITIYKCNFNIHVFITGSNLIRMPYWIWRTFFTFAGAYFQYRVRKQVIWSLYSAVYVSGSYNPLPPTKIGTCFKFVFYSAITVIYMKLTCRWCDDVVSWAYKV